MLELCFDGFDENQLKSLTVSTAAENLKINLFQYWHVTTSACITKARMTAL